MTDHDSRESSTKALHRMIAYLREEALRLGIMDVAVLLEHAEEAVIGFSPVPSREHRDGTRGRLGSVAEH